MYNPSPNWMEQIKLLVHEIVKSRQFVLEGLVTSVDPNPPYKVRVNLQPYDIETGWLKVMTPYAGNGFGIILPPPDEGAAVKVIFDMGDIKNGTVIGEMFNTTATMPNVTVGTLGLVHKSGSSILIAPDGTVTVRGKSTTQSW